MKPPPAASGGARLGRVRYSAVELLVALVLLFLVTPFVQDMPHGKVIEVSLVTLVIVSAVLAVGARGGARWVSVLLAATALGARWTDLFSPHSLPVGVFHAAALLFLGYVVLHILRFIFQAPQVNSEVLCAAIAAYLLIGLVWALNYMFLGRLSPEAFAFSAGPQADRTMNSFNAFYFSFVVLSTVGFGDITPISKAARMLAVTEALTGLFYVTVLISRLVAMYVPAANRTPPSSSS
jgi:hypothetical protein